MNNFNITADSLPISITISPTVVAPPPPPPPPPVDPTTLPLIQQGTFTRTGSFKLPQGPQGTDTYATFEYGGGMLSYDAARNGLFVGSHVWRRYIAEVTIPANGGTAAFIQPFADPSEGKSPLSITLDANGADKGGSLVVGDKLYTTWYADYGSSTLGTHLMSSSDLSVQGDVSGPFTVGAGPTPNDMASDYMSPIPKVWQALLGGTHLTGNCCKNIISRTSYGPAVFAFTPPPAGATSRILGNPLVYYTGANPLAPASSTNNLFNLATHIRGVVFPEGSRSVLFFGRQGIGTYLYGATTADGGSIVDPDDSSKGTHAYPYVYQVWAYDAIDLLSVRNGTRQPWSVRPYATWTLTLPKAKMTDIYGAAYDPTSGTVFISQAFGDGDQPLIHTYKTS